MKRFVGCDVILLLLHLAARASALSHVMIEKWREVCPYNRYCTVQSNLTLLDRGQTPCCHPCSCEADCGMYKNCCPDVQQSSAKLRSFPCTSLNAFLNDIRQVKRIPDQTKSYRIVNKCPKDSESLISAHCANPKTLTDYLIVSDAKTSERVYANIHCAECHRVDKIVEWKLFVHDCEGLFKSTFKTFKERDHYVIKNCALMAFPPTPTIGRKSECFDQRQDVIGQCNVTSWWNQYDPKLEDACSGLGIAKDMYNYVYQTSRSGQFFIYKNPSCFLCNNYHPINFSQQCNSEVLANEIGGLNGALLTALDVEMTSKIQNNESDASVCQQYEVFDKLTSNCLNLLCPGGYIPIHGTCVTALPGYVKTNIETYFAILLPEPLRPDTRTLHSGLMSSLSAFLQDLVGGVCEMCTSTLITDNSLTIYFLKYSVQTSEECPLLKLKLALQNISDQGFEYGVKNAIHETLTATVIPILKTFPKQETVLSFLRGVYRCSSQIRYDISMIKSCPKLNVPVGILSHLGFNSTGISNVVEETNGQEAEGYVTICAKDYFQLVSKYSPNESNETATNIPIGRQTVPGNACSLTDLQLILLLRFVAGGALITIYTVN